MKKIIITLHGFLIMLLCAHVLFLWSDLTRTSEEQIRLEDYRFEPPVVFKSKLRQNYPPLFDIEPPESEPSESRESGEGETGKNQKADQLDTRAGILRLRAIFIRDNTPLALLETFADGSSQYKEAMENETIHDYQISEITSGSISLIPKEGGSLVELVIFDRDRDRIGSEHGPQ